MDSMLEHSNKVNNNLTTSKTDNVKINDCNGLVLANPGNGDEVSQIPPLVALQQQHEELLANGDLTDQKPRTAESAVNNTNSECVTSANNSRNNSNKNSPNNSSVLTPETTSNNNNNSCEFSSNDIKIEPKGIRTSECATSNGLLTNGSDNVLSVESIDGTIKNSTEGDGGGRSNVNNKPLDKLMPSLPPPVSESKDEKIPVPNLNNDANVAPINQPSHHPQAIGIAPPAPSATVQPLPSNVLNKPTDAQRDAQYMQQNQIFVFSTALANEGAEAVNQHHFPSIIAFHCEQPGTKAFLEKHPLQIEQFSKHNNPSWLNFTQPRTGRNIRMNRSGPAMNTNSPINPYMGSVMPVPGNGPNGNGNVGYWNAHMYNRGPAPGNEMCSGGNCCPSMPHGSVPGNQSMPMMMPDKSESQSEKQMMNFPNPNMPGLSGPGGPGHVRGCTPPSGCNMNPMMNPAAEMNQGSRLLDDNLTPEQRASRENKLSFIQKWKNVLFKPDGTPQTMHGNNCSPMPGEMMPIEGQQMVPPVSSMNGCNPTPGSGPHQMIQPIHSGNPQHSQMNPVNAQIEWNKLEHQYLEEKKRRNVKGQNIGGQLNQSNQSMISQSPNVPLDPNAPGPRMHGPPPPYPQPSSVRQSAPTSSSATNTANMQQPSPISTMSPASASLSLPSPHSNVPTTSINSPAAPRIPLPSPGSSISTCTTTAIGGNSMHNTPLNSPSPALNNPRSVGNPTTPGGSAVMTSTSPGLRPQDTMNTPLTPNPSNNQPFADASYSRTLQNIVQSQQRPTKEPSLMPVPSPQQIQYLNAFEGQELTIQKQPNTSLKEANIMSPANMPSVENSSQYPVASPASVPHQQHGPATPQFCSPGDQPTATRVTPDSMGPRFQMNDVPPFQGLSPQNSMEMSVRFATPSPHSHSQQSMGSIEPGMPRMHAPSPHNEAMNRFPNNQAMPGPMCGGNMQRFPVHPNRMPTMDPMHRFPNPNPMQEPMQRFPGPNFEARFRAPCPNPSDQMPQKFRAMSTPSMNNRFSAPTLNDGMGGSNMRFPTSSASQVISGASGQGSSVHMQGLEKLANSLKVPANKMQPDAAGSPYGNNANPSIVPSANTSSAQDITQMQGQKLTHFDPLASMAEMSTPTGPSSTTMAPSHSQPGMMNNMSPMQFSGAGNSANAQTNMSNMQNMQQNMSSTEVMQNSAVMNNQMTQNIGTGPQTVNNTFLNTTMSVQQLNIQNATNVFNPNVQVQQMSAHPPIGGQNAPYVSSSANLTPQANMSPKTMVANNMSTPGHNPRCVHPPHFMPTPRGMAPNALPATNMNNPRPQANETRPFNGTNVQVKQTAPNTIQYMPTRAQRTTATNRTPSLEFLNRFTAPITNLESKVPTQNLQYFPSADGSGGNNTIPGQNVNVGMNQMMGQPGNMNGGMPDQMDNRQYNPRAQQVMIRGPVPQHMMGNEQMYPSGAPISMMNNEQSNFVHSQMPNQIMNNQIMHSAPGQPMFMGGKPPMNMMSPEASQHLPPSMGNQQPAIANTNFNNCPTTSDPNYGARFHNFQQQLYATNARPTGGPMNNPNMMSGQYYMPK